MMTAGANKSLRPDRLFSATYSSPHGAASPSRLTARSLPRRRRHALPRLALLGPDRGIDLHHQPVRLALGRLEHRESGTRYCCRFYHPLDHFDRTVSLRFKRGLDVFDHGLELLIRQLLDQIALLNPVLARTQQR